MQQNNTNPSITAPQLSSTDNALQSRDVPERDYVRGSNEDAHMVDLVDRLLDFGQGLFLARAREIEEYPDYDPKRYPSNLNDLSDDVNLQGQQ